MTMPAMFKVSLGLIGGSLLLFLSGFFSNFWFTRPGLHFGLWLICYPSGCVTYDQVLPATPAHAYVGRFCTIYQLIGVIVSLVLLCLFVFKSARQNWVKSGYSTLLSAGIVGFLGAVIFIGREKSLDYGGTLSVGWSGILVIFASIMQIVAAVLIILPVRKGEVEFEQA